MIVSQGTLNTSALVVPDLYVQIVPPQNYLINGSPTNQIGVVGTAAWGPVDQPVIIGNMPAFTQQFGAPVIRKYDMGTHVATAILQGATAFKCVRVTDGTDAAATSTGVATCITFTANYTGSLGNNITVKIAAGSKASSWRAIVGVPGGQPEVFDNITGTGAAFWNALVAAINKGAGVLRGPSQLVTATIGTPATTAPAAVTCAFTGGTDGAAVADTDVVGVDTDGGRQGIYALRAQGCSILVASDCDNSDQWSVIDELALAEGMYAIQTGPSGDTISNAATVKASAGLDSYSSKLMFGDWILWSDPFNAVERYVSPQGFVAGRLANLSPEQSSLNKPLYGVIATQKSGSNPAQSSTYSSAELQALVLAGLDVVTNPGAGGLSMWTCRVGHNSASNAAVQGDNYTRLTNFIAASLDAGMGYYCGKVINSDLPKQVKATLNSFLMGMYGQGLLGTDVDDGGLPFSVICDLGPNTNNPPERTKLGYFQADAQVQYQAINEKFIVNIEGGQTVTVRRQTLPAGQVTA